MMKRLIDKLEKYHQLTKDEYISLIENRNPEISRYLFEKSRNIRELHYGKKVFIRGLIEFTNYCKNDCYYCGIRRSNKNTSRYRLTKEQILDCCKEGNNGGDGFVAARRLHELGAKVNIVLVEGEPKTEDAIKNKLLCESLNIPFYNGKENVSEVQFKVSKADIIIDAIYGTGFHGELREPVRNITKFINASKAHVYALDIPSGLNGDTCYADSDTVIADETIVFHRLKPAHADERCVQYFGRIICISIGIEQVLGSDS
jgi:NAD(P)H-hydrate epimerase